MVFLTVTFANCAGEVLGPLVTDQLPVPIAGALPFKVVLALEQIVTGLPATAAVGNLLKATITSSVEVQIALVIVQRKVYVVPAVPLNTDAGFAVFAKLPPAPLTMLHAPVPRPGVFAARVTEVNPQVAALV